MDRQIYDRIRLIEDRHWWFQARRRILADLIGGLGLPPHAQVLEVGCGTGGNLPMLKAFGQVRAIEPDEASRSYAAQRRDVSVMEGLLPDGLPFTNERFDLIAALDVVEHVDQDGAAVAAMARLLKPGGFLVTTVPAYQWMWSGHDEQHHHRRRYRLDSYSRLFTDAGLSVHKATYFNTLLFPLIAGVRLAKKALSASGSDEDSVPGDFLNRLLGGLFAAERHWLRRARFPFGVSILVTARN